MIWNIPNLLTLFRIAAAGLYLFLALQGMWREAFWVFTVAAVTDLVDGAIARFFHQQTPVGAFLDPAADKLLMFFGFLTLAVARAIPLPLFFVVLARDLMITLGVLFLAVRKAPVVFKPLFLSKIATLAQILFLFGMLASSAGVSDTSSLFPSWVNFLSRLLPILGWVVGGLVTVTGIQYFQIGWRISKTHEKN